MTDIVNVGTTPNDGTGDSLRTAMQNINTEFARIAAQKVVAVTDFGAVGDDSTNNVTAINNAAASLPFGGIVTVPPGTFRVASALTTFPDAVSLVGHGSAASVIRTTSATADVLAVGDRALVSGLKFMSSVTRTGGSYVKLTGNSAIIDACEMDGAYIGIYCYAAALYTETGADIHRCILRGGSATAGGAAILIERFGDVNISDTTISGNTTVAANQADSGIKITGCDTVTIQGCNITQAGVAIDVAPTASDVLSVWVDSTYCDWNAKASGPGARVGIYSGANNLRRVRFSGCWFGTNAGPGLLVEQTAGTGELDGVDVIGCHIYNNGSYGAKAAGSAKNVHFLGGESAGNTGSGVYVGGTVDTFSVIGMRLGPFADYGANSTYGLELAGSVDHGRVGLNDLRGNTSGAVLNGTSGTDVNIRDNLGWTTENGGAAVILSGTTAIAVTHNLSSTPVAKELWVTPTQNPTNDPGNWWIDTITSTQFTINVRNNPGASNMSFAWGARLQ